MNPIEKSRGDLFANETAQIAYHCTILLAVALATIGYMDLRASAGAQAYCEFGN